MDRVLEPELMDDDAQSRAYANADFAVSNQRFVDGLVNEFGSSLRRVVDLGCGPADVVLRLARAAPHAAITAVDGSAPMIALARDAVRAAGAGGQITLLEAVLPGLPLDAQAFDAVLSKDLLHHLADPSALWREVVRVGRPGAVVYVMDLIRPDTPDAARAIVDAAAGAEAAILQQDFFNSLCAAFTIEEVTAQLHATRLDHLEVTRSGDRHLLVSGRLSGA
jgi:ubiquinone/menaquinone biosynthesis C-methylase UbiE